MSRLPRRRREARRVAGGFALVGAACLGAATFGASGNVVADTRAGLPMMAVGSGASDVSVTWLGDTLVGDAAQPYIDEFGPDWVSARLRPFDADLVVANLEGPITTRTEPWDPGQRWSYQTDPKVAAALSRLGIDVASLANNHAMDRGPQGLADTVANLNDAGVRSFGAGSTSAESRIPLLVRTPVGTLAIVALADVDAGSGTASPGVRRLSLENLQGANEAARRAGATRVVAFVHWGENYEPINDDQRRWASAFEAAGYDLVVGTGPHIVQPIEFVGRMPVAYSLGNFIMTTPGRFAKRDVPGYGLVLTTRFSRDGQLTLSAECIVTDNQLTTYQSQPCQGEDAVATLRALHPGIRVEGDTGTLIVPVSPGP